MYYPGSNNWWLDPQFGRFDIRANGGSPLASLDSLGRLGIGTTNPSRLLTISGSGNAGIGINTTGTGAGNTAQIAFGEQSTEKAYLTWWSQFGTLGMTSGAGTDGIHFNPTTGNVGIGTSGPATRLHVLGDFHVGSQSWRQAYIQQGLGIASAPNYSFWANLDTGMFLPAANTLAFSTLGIERVRVDGGGSVGIGTTNPLNQLHVVGNARFEGGDFLRVNPAAPLDQKVWRQYNDSSTWYLATMPDSLASENIFLRIARTGTTVNSIAFSQGNVGIGPATPARMLHLSGFSDGGIRVQSTDAVSGASRIELGSRTSQSCGDLIWSEASQALTLWSTCSGAGTGSIELNSGSTGGHISLMSGNVGVGTSAPAAALDVAGTAQMTGFSLPTGAASGKVLTSDLSGVGTWQPAAAGGGGTVPTIQVLSAGSFVIPAGVTKILVEVWGGGGAGGSASSLWNSGGGGGGAGGYGKQVLTVTPGDSYTVTVGGAGGASSFAGAAGTISAAGGSAGTAAGSGGGPGGAGGTSAATLNITGGSGGGASAGHGGTTPSCTAGGQGGSAGGGGGGGGGGGKGSCTFCTVGNPGSVPGGGGGGGGGWSSCGGGAGAAGRVVVSY